MSIRVVGFGGVAALLVGLFLVLQEGRERGGTPVWRTPPMDEWMLASAQRLAQIVADGVPSGSSYDALGEWNQAEWDRIAESSGVVPEFPALLSVSATHTLPVSGPRPEGGWGEQFTVDFYFGKAGEEVVRVFRVEDEMVAIGVSAVVPELVERWVVFDYERFEGYLRRAAATRPSKSWREIEGNRRWW